MHLPGYPKYYTKDGKRRSVYYTAEARDLKAMGWVPEEDTKKPVEPKAVKAAEEVKAAKPEKPPVIPIEVVDENPKDEGLLPDFEFMTRSELLEYALQRGVDLPNNALKADLVEACRKIGK